MAQPIKKLKEIRESKFMTQMDLADAAYVTVRTISHAENSGKVSISVIKRIAKALKVQPGDLQ